MRGIHVRTGYIDETLEYYQQQARSVCERYEQVDSELFLQGLPLWIQRGNRILDLGCGSGRDAAYLLSEGYDVYGADGSQAMLDRALELHPEPEGRLSLTRLPARLEYEDDSFDAVISIALLMHLGSEEIQQVCREIHRILSSHGVFWLSIRMAEATGCEDPMKDELGRYMSHLSVETWKALIDSAGFYCTKYYEDEDALGRSCRWGRFAFVKDAN